MGKEAIIAMANILDNQSNIAKEIRSEVYKLLGLNTQYEQLSEFVAECLEKFNFNSEEVLFLEQLRMTVNEEINKIDLQRKNNEQVNYEIFQIGLVEKLKESKTPVINIDDNLKDLANQIVERFPQINVSKDQLYNHFMSKKTQVIEMINQHNKNIVEALIKITPQLAQELENQTQVNENTQTLQQPQSDLLNDQNIRKPSEPTEPKSPVPIETYIGATNEDVESLIQQNKYFLLLQGIKKEDSDKYRGFILTGYNILIDNWYKKASSCKTYDEKHDAYFELYEIYQNFRDYISLEQSNQLREQLDNVLNYLQEQKRTTDDVGIRYNTEKTGEQRSSSIRR